MIDELLKIKEKTIPHNNCSLNWKKSKYGKPNFGGIYAFWWKGNTNSFLQVIQNNIIHFTGPQKVQLKLELNESIVNTAKNGYVPLYIGKNAKNIASRIGQHLLLKTSRSIDKNEALSIKKKKTTSCQVRDRIDRIFPFIEDTRAVVIENLAISYIRIDGVENFVKRFFFEDLAIGIFRPIFNIDSER